MTKMPEEGGSGRECESSAMAGLEDAVEAGTRLAFEAVQMVHRAQCTDKSTLHRLPACRASPVEWTRSVWRSSAKHVPSPSFEDVTMVAWERDSRSSGQRCACA